jgi:hypothetical protein
LLDKYHGPLIVTLRRRAGSTILHFTFVNGCSRRGGIRYGREPKYVRDFRKISVALESLRGLCLANPASLSKVCNQWPEDGREDFIELMLNGIKSFEKAFKAALASDEFQRKGRPESRRGPYLHLVISAHGLLEQFAGRPPGFGRETDTPPGPLVRTVRAIYRYAAGNRLAPGEFDRYIAQAERLSQRPHSDTSVAAPLSKLRRASR